MVRDTRQRKDAMGERAIVQMRHISKTFPGVVANEDVNLTLNAGEVHAILGENGAGKSTLMNVLTGSYRPDSGEIYYKGQKTHLRKPKDATMLGIGMVHQHFRLVEPFSVTENIVLVDKHSRMFFNPAKEAEKISAFSEKYGFKVDPLAKIWQLSIGEQQRVEILKLLYQGAEILILDEPTAVLAAQEVEVLFENLHRIAQTGKSVAFITHKLNEVMKYAHRITLLRGGKSVASMLRADASKEELTRLMVGRALVPTRNIGEGKIGEVKLSLKGVCASNDKQLPALVNVDLAVHAGEIVCIAGVAGNGQREIGEVVAGLRRASGGQIVLNGVDVTNRQPKEIIRRGYSFVPEDRLGMGLIPTFSLTKNTILKNYDTEASSHKKLLKIKTIQRNALQMVEQNNIKTSGVQYPVRLMSGGNQQKLLFAREICEHPSVIVATYPSRGLDIGAVESIHKILLEEKAKGTAILLISEDLDEIFKLADRIAVLFEGRVMGDLQREHTSHEQVGLLMLGEDGLEECEPG